MTIEEAIYRLKNTAWLGSDDDREEAEEAVVMAIKALEDIERWRTWSHTYDNIISKAKVLETYSELYWFDSDCEVVSKAEVDKIYERLQSLPSADRPTGEWIKTEHCLNDTGDRRWIEIECPFCGERPTYEFLENMNYCPNCGCLMKKGD